jgi:hypothetical protein
MPDFDARPIVRRPEWQNRAKRQTATFAVPIIDNMHV